jgi:hypothetical protein
MAKTPETSDHTSVIKRCDNANKSNNPNQINEQEKLLYPFVGNPRENQPEGIQMKLSDYLELVNRSVLRDDKGGAISAGSEKHLLGSILMRIRG